jgi:hypothetical protein
MAAVPKTGARDLQNKDQDSTPLSTPCCDPRDYLKNANAHVGLGKVRLGQDMIVQGREL